MDNFEYYLTTIEELLRRHPEGMTISDIAKELGMSRNTIGKYIEIMCLSGAADLRTDGKSKIYFLAPRIPVTRILSYIQDAIIQTDHRYRIVYVNLGAMDLLSGDEDELMGRDVLDLLVLQGMSLEMRAQITGTNPDDACTTGMVIRLHDQDHTFWMTCVGMVMYNGAPGHILIFHDITDWKEAEEKKKKYEFLFSTLAEETFEQVFIYSSDYSVRYANPSYLSGCEEKGGLPPGWDLLRSYDKKAAQLIRDHTESVLETHDSRRFIFPVTDQGRTRWLDTRLHPFPGGYEGSREVLGITRDISGFQEGGSAPVLLSALLSTMAEGVLTVTAGGTILTWNRGAEMITGYPSEELLGGMAQIVIPPELNGGQDVITDTVRGHPVTDLKMTIRAKGGRKRKVIMSTTTVPDHSGAISQVVLVWREP